MKTIGFELRLNVGRWQGVNDYMVVDDLDGATLRKIAKKFWAESNNAKDRSTQVLIWNASESVHNLIAIWTQDRDRLVVL